ncbi:MAG TPA: hypothetical protein VGF76_02915, partial [Polyangiaceae bacterium]
MTGSLPAIESETMGLEQVGASARRARRATSQVCSDASVRRWASVAVLLVASLLLSSAAAAQTDSDADLPDPLALETHAFVSQGFLESNQNNYLTSRKRGSFEFTEVGINFTKA